MRRRIYFLLFLFLLFTLLLLSRVYYLSIKSNTYYEKLSQDNLIKHSYTLPSRGIIKDRVGKPLAINKLGFSLALQPDINDSKLTKELDFFTHFFPDFNRTKLRKTYTNKRSAYNHDPIMIAPFIPYDDVISSLIPLSKNQDFVISPASQRYYPTGALTAHILGYVAKADTAEIEASKVTKLTSLVGKSGIENYYNTLLEGELGEQEKHVTALNEVIDISTIKEPHSTDITLTLDSDLQAYLEKVFGAHSGAIIVMNAKNGSILAAGSYPTYDNNEFVQGISNSEWKKMIEDLNHPFTNKFIHGLYPPGSSTKPEVLLSFLSSGKLKADEKLRCDGVLKLGKRKFRCWHKAGHGEVDSSRALRESCDVYFYKGGLRTGIDTISTNLLTYGFGAKTGIDMPSEFIGTVPNRNWKIKKFADSWYKGDTLNTVIGQGDFLVTPMQVAQATALMATGKQVVPHFIRFIGENNVSFTPKDILTTTEKKNLLAIQQGMYEVCNHKHGTAYRYNKAWITMAGKTGTSQVVGISQEEIERMSEDDLHYYKKSHAWFTSYAPYQDPQYVITAIVEHGGHGGKAAATMVSKVYNYLVLHGYIAKKYVKKSIDLNQTKL